MILQFYRWFKRPKTTIYIFAALTILYFLGLIIPQKMFFKTKAEYDAWMDAVPYLFRVFDFLGFTDIYLSPVTLFFLTAFFLNLIAVTIERVPVLIRQAHVGKVGTPTFAIADIRRSGRAREIETGSADKAAVFEVVQEYFERGGWFLLKNEMEGTMIAVKNRLAVFGFLLFHLSFFLLLAGGGLIFYSRFSGYLVLSEGEAYSGDIRQFRQILRKPKIMSDIKIPPLSLEKVEMNYEGDRKTDLFITLRTGSGSSEKTETIGVNRPATIGNVTILANTAGVTPLFVLKDSSGSREIDGAWLSLNVLEGREDFFSFRNDPKIIYRARFFPDYIVENGVETSRSPKILNPAFHISAEREGKVIADATIRPGQGMVFEQYMLIFEDMRFWGELLVVREAGPSFLVIGFFLGITGLIMRLVFYRREVRVAIDDGKMYLLGISALNQISFEEKVGEVVQELKGRVTCEPNVYHGKGHEGSRKNNE